MKLKEYLDSNGIKPEVFAVFTCISLGTLKRAIQGKEIGYKTAELIIGTSKGSVTMDDLKVGLIPSKYMSRRFNHHAG